MDVQFECRVTWVVSCNECGKDSPVEGWRLGAGDTIPHPTLPDGWINLGERGVVCLDHTVILGQRP